MNNDRIITDAYINFLSDLDESILVWQKNQKELRKDKRFSAKKYLARKLGYKDENVVYRFLDPNDVSKAKMGMEDAEQILLTIGDLVPLDNYYDSLKQELKRNSK